MISYFKSRQPSNPVVYVEDQQGWKSYAPGGVIQKNIGALPNYLRQHADEVPLDEVIDLIRSCEAEADLKARERALEPVAPWGIGGWLVLPIIGLCITAIWSLVDIFRYLPGLWRAWDVLTDSASSAYHPLWGPYIGFASFFQFFLLLVPIFLLWLIAKRKRILPSVIIGFYVAVLFILVVDFVAVITFLSQWAVDRGIASEASTDIFDSVQRVWKGIILCGIWIPYFLFSSRVRATFTEPMSERARRTETESRRSLIAALAAEKRTGQEREAKETGPLESSPTYQPWPVPSYVPQPVTSPALPPATGSGARRWVLLIPVIAVLIIVVGLVTGLAVWRDLNPPQAKNPVTISTDVNGNTSKRYSNKDFSFSFDYPSGWILEDNSISDNQGMHQLSVYDPTGESLDGLAMDSATIGAYALTDVMPAIDAIRADLRAGFKDDMATEGLEVVKELADVTVNGMPGLSGLCRSTESNGDHIMVPIYWLWGDDYFYYIAINYSDRPSDSAKGDLDAILASFKGMP